MEVDVTSLVNGDGNNSFVAAAGCGKTEAITRATAVGEGRRLILTHTHAGKDALVARLAKQRIPTDHYTVETIAGWALRYVRAYPRLSGWTKSGLPLSNEWEEVYAAARRLLGAAAIRRVVRSSYNRILVDEYQDCSSSQHQLVVALAGVLPTKVFGDHLQSIFDFKEEPVDWERDVFPVFPKAADLTRPWRWENVGNLAHAEWLAHVREQLELHGQIDLREVPATVTWCEAKPHEAQQLVARLARQIMRETPGTIAIIADASNKAGRSRLARAVVGAREVEAQTSSELIDAAAEIDAASGMDRLASAMAFSASCQTNTEQPEFLECVKSWQAGRSRGRDRFEDLIQLGLDVAANHECSSVSALLRAFSKRSKARVYRQEALQAMLAALHLRESGAMASLSDAMGEVLNRARHRGRRVGGITVGSTLLLKGLEFDHAILVAYPGMSEKDLYVALTRATRTATVISFERQLPIHQKASRPVRIISPSLWSLLDAK